MKDSDFNNLTSSDLKVMFSNLICSDCGADFDENSFSIARDDGYFIVVHIECPKCGKDYGLVFMGNYMPGYKNKPLDIQQTPKGITKDEVLDAHNFIQNLDESWSNKIPKDFKSE